MSAVAATTPPGARARARETRPTKADRRDSLLDAAAEMVASGVVETVSGMAEDAVVALPPDPNGGEAIAAAIDRDTSCVVVQSPSFYGHLVDLRPIAEETRVPFRATARIRHRAEEVPATVTPDGGSGARVEFDRPVRAAAPGQSCVFYDGDIVRGGGVLRKVVGVR